MAYGGARLELAAGARARLVGSRCGLEQTARTEYRTNFEGNRGTEDKYKGGQNKRLYNGTAYLGRAQSAGLSVLGAGIGIQGLGFRVQGLGLRVHGLGFRA